MNKKIMSFVLAMVLSVGLGVSALYAGGSEYNTDNYFSNRNDAGTLKTTGSSTTAKGVVIKVGSPEDTLSGSITAVYSFYAGIMTGYKSADGGVVIMDSEGQRAVMSAVDDVWTVESYNIRQSDLMAGDFPKLADYVKTDEKGNPIKDEDGNYEFLNEEAEKAYVTKWTQYLKDRGFSDEQLRCAVLDEEGHPVDKNGKAVGENAETEIDYNSLPASFFTMLQDNLSKGGNYTATITSGNGITGVNATIYKDGDKPVISFAADYSTYNKNDKGDTLNAGTGFPNGIRPTANYYYDKGFLQMTEQYTMESNVIDKENGEVVYEWTKTVTVSDYKAVEYTDENGKTNTYYQQRDITLTGKDIKDYKFEDLANPDSALNKDINTIKALNFSALNEDTVTATGLTFTVTNYSANGTKIEMFNSEDRTKTFYMNGNLPTKTYNAYEGEDKTPTTVYSYTDNNVMLGYVSVTGIGADGTVGHQTTVCDKHGAAQGVVNGDIDFAEALKLVTEVKSDIASGKISAIPSDSLVVSINIYASDLKDPTALANFKKYFGWTNADVTNMLNFSYGDGPLASVRMAYSEQLPEGGNDETADGVTAVTTSVSAGTHTQWQTLDDVRSGWTFTSTILLGGAQAYQVTQNVVTSQKIVLEKDPAVEGTLFPEVTDEELREAGIDPEDKDAVEKYKEKKQNDLAEDLGIGHYEGDTFVIDDQEAYDNMMEGFYYDKETGQTYALLNASKAYLMDGSENFETVSGEVLLVGIGTAQDIKEAKSNFKAIADNIGADKKIMFMGNIGSDVAGHLVLTMNTEWSGGFVTNDGVENKLDKVKEDITIISNAEYNLREGNITNKEYNDIMGKVNANGEYDWVVANSQLNIGALGGHYSWTETGLRGAWQRLQEALAIIF